MGAPYSWSGAEAKYEMTIENPLIKQDFFFLYLFSEQKDSGTHFVCERKTDIGIYMKRRISKINKFLLEKKSCNLTVWNKPDEKDVFLY